MWPLTQIARLFRKKPPEPLPPPLVTITYEVGDFLSEYEFALVSQKETCPDCGAVDRFIELKQRRRTQAHFKCGSETCGSEFRAIFPFGTQRLSDACPLTPPPRPEVETPYRG